MSSLLASIGKFVGQFLLEKNDRLTHTHPILRAAEAQHIHACLPRDLLGQYIQTGDGIGKPRPVHMQPQSMPPAGIVNGRQFIDRVHRGKLRGLRHAHHAGFWIMDVSASLNCLRDRRRRKLAAFT